MPSSSDSLYPIHAIPGGPAAALRRLHKGLSLLGGPSALEGSSEPKAPSSIPAILFIGTGRGEHPITAAERLGYTVFGIDEEPDDILYGKMAAIDRRLPSPPVLKTMSPLTLDFEDGSMDLVQVEGILTSYPRRAVLSEIHRVLKPGGVLVLFDPRWKTVPVPHSVKELWESRSFPVLTREENEAVLRELHFNPHAFEDASSDLEGFYRQFSRDIRAIVQSGFEDMKHVKKLVTHYKHEIDMYARFGGRTYMGLGVTYAIRLPN